MIISTEEGPRELTVMGRKVLLQRTCGRILDTTFHELCIKVNQLLIFFSQIFKVVHINFPDEFSK